MSIQPRIVFFGTPEFAAYCLDFLIDNGCNVVGVVTMPDKPAGRGHRLFQSPVKEVALRRGLPLMQPVRLKDPDFLKELGDLHADLFTVIAFRMLPAAVWQMPPMGTFNLHASLLPRYRGAAPINWAIINGDTQTGVTTFFLKQEIDTGDIIGRDTVDIGPDDDAGTVHDRLMHAGAALTLATIKSIADGTACPLPQASAEGEPTEAPKIFKPTCMIDWARPAGKVHDFVRGLSPYPAAWSMLHSYGAPDMELKVLRTSVTDAPSTNAPGTIHVAKDGSLTVDCSDMRIAILRLQPQGKKAMDAAEFIRGFRATPLQF